MPTTTFNSFPLTGTPLSEVPTVSSLSSGDRMLVLKNTASGYFTRSIDNSNLLVFQNSVSANFWVNFGSASGNFLQESATPFNIQMTGYKISVVNFGSGQQLSGNFYQRNNSDIGLLTDFTLNTNSYSKTQSINTSISGGSNFGIDINQPFLSGGNGLLISLFGYLPN